MGVIRRQVGRERRQSEEERDTTIRWLGPNIKNIIYIGVKYQKEMTEILRVP